jgi:hypothetical protein
MFLFVYALALVLLAACWYVGELEVRTKLILTAVYLATFGLCLVQPIFLVTAQALFCIVVGLLTFGPSIGRR